MKNTLLSLTFVVALICGHLYSCSSGTTQTGNENSTGADKDSADIQPAEPDFNDFLACFEKCSLPYPGGFLNTDEKEIPEVMVNAFITKNNSVIGKSSGSDILLSKGRFSLQENRNGVIFTESNSDGTEKSTRLFVFDADGKFRSSYQLEYSYRGAASREHTTSEISTSLHILTQTLTEEKDLVSDEWISTEESAHYMINNEGLIVDSSYE